MSTVSLLLVEDHAVVRQGYRRFLNVLDCLKALKTYG
jgi:DNA-binding NarL/FixJ family response regulator